MLGLTPPLETHPLQLHGHVLQLLLECCYMCRLMVDDLRLLSKLKARGGNLE